MDTIAALRCTFSRARTRFTTYKVYPLVGWCESYGWVRFNDDNGCSCRAYKMADGSYAVSFELLDDGAYVVGGGKFVLTLGG